MTWHSNNSLPTCWIVKKLTYGLVLPRIVHTVINKYSYSINFFNTKKKKSETHESKFKMNCTNFYFYFYFLGSYPMLYTPIDKLITPWSSSYETHFQSTIYIYIYIKFCGKILLCWPKTKWVEAVLVIFFFFFFLLSLEKFYLKKSDFNAL